LDAPWHVVYEYKKKKFPISTRFSWIMATFFQFRTTVRHQRKSIILTLENLKKVFFNIWAGMFFISLVKLDLRSSNFFNNRLYTICLRRPYKKNRMDWGPVTEAATHSWEWFFLQIARLTMFEPGLLCEDLRHLVGNRIFKNLESLKPWANKMFRTSLGSWCCWRCRKRSKAQKLDWRKLHIIFWLTQLKIKLKYAEKMIQQILKYKKSDLTNSKSNLNMQKKWFNQLKIKLIYMQNVDFFAFKCLILSG
jgi:hypothetical protein